MALHHIEIKPKNPMNTSETQQKADLVEVIANNLDLEPLKILAEKSKKPGIGKKLIQFRNMI